jgi:hypothetical protein
MKRFNVLLRVPIWPDAGFSSFREQLARVATGGIFNFLRDIPPEQLS